MAEQLVLGQLARRARVDVVDLHAGRERHAGRHVGIVAAGVDHHLVPAPRQPRASSATCTFWPPASTPPRTASGLACSETIATLIYATSSSSSSQSARNLASP